MSEYVNFSSLQQNTTAANTDQFLIRLDNSLSGSEGFARINKVNLEQSFGVHATTNALSSNWQNTYITYSSLSSSYASNILSIPATAWIQTTGNGGNDSTAEIGNPAKPYATMQAAYDAGATIMHVGVGTFAGITATTSITLSIIGAGRSRTIITLIRSTTASVTLQDLGVHSATITTVSTYGQNSSVAGGVGGNGSNATLINCYVSSINTTGGTGGSGDESVIEGGIGGSGGIATLINVTVSNVYTYGGTGGSPYNDGSSTLNGSTGGDAGNLVLHNCIITSINGNGGGGGEGVNGGSYGNGGTGASISGTNVDVVDCYCSGGSEGGSNGSIDMHRTSITQTLYMDGVNGGTISGATLYISAISSGTPPSVNAVFSYIDGATY